MATRQGRESRDFNTVAEGYKSLFASLFKSGLVVENLEQTTGYNEEPDPLKRPYSDYIAGVLYSYGRIAYMPSTGIWAPCYSEGPLNLYLFAPRYTLATPTPMLVKRAQVVILRANPESEPLERLIRNRCDVLADFDNAIHQNLDAIKDMAYISTDSNEVALQVRRADKARRAGASVCVINRQAIELSNLELLSTGAEYKIDRLLEDRRKLFEETLHLVNVYTPIEKGERMITDEIYTQNSETNSYTGIVINTFNADAERQGVPFRLRVNNRPVSSFETGEGEATPAPSQGGESGETGTY